MSYVLEAQKRRAARIAMVAMVCAVLCADGIFVARLLYTGGSFTGSFISHLVRGPHAWVAMASLGCWALACFFTSFAVGAALHPTPWVPAGLLLLRLQGVALALLALSPPGSGVEASSLATILHTVGYFASFFFGAFAALVLASAFRWDPDWIALRYPARAVSFLLIALTGGLMLWPPENVAWWEIGSIATTLLWLLLCGVGTLRAVRWFRLPWESRPR